MIFRRYPCRAILVLLLCLAGGAALAQTATPRSGPLPALTEPAKNSATNRVLVWKDPDGRVIGQVKNPEASKPLHLGDTAKAQADGKPRGIGGQILSMLLSLALVLGVAYLVMLVLKRIYQGNLRLSRPTGTTAPKRLLRVLEQQALGQGRGVYLIAVGGRAYLIGLSSQQMTVLGEVTEDAQIAEALAEDAAFVPPVATQPFAHLLARLLPTAPAAKAPDAELEQRIATDPASAVLEQISEARKERRPEDAE